MSGFALYYRQASTVPLVFVPVMSQVISSVEAGVTRWLREMRAANAWESKYDAVQSQNHHAILPYGSNVMNN